MATLPKYQPDLSSKLLHCQVQGLRGGVPTPERPAGIRRRSQACPRVVSNFSVVLVKCLYF